MIQISQFKAKFDLNCILYPEYQGMDQAYISVSECSIRSDTNTTTSTCSMIVVRAKGNKPLFLSFLFPSIAVSKSPCIISPLGMRNS